MNLQRVEGGREMNNIEKIRQEIERRKGKSYYPAMIELLNIIEEAQGGDNLVDYPSYKKGYFDGRQDEKEQMTKDAVEGEVVKDITNKLAVTAKNINLDGFKFGDKVKIIIVKQ